jgi:outer membrane protein assembly factor BamB
MIILLALMAGGCNVLDGKPDGPAILWTHADGDGSAGRPYADAELAVFQTAFDTRIVALGARNGSLRWSRTLPREVPHLYLPGGEILGYEDLLIVPAWDLYGLDRATGDIRWRYGPPEEYPAATSIALHDGVIFSPGARKLHAVRAEDGQPIWTTDLGERPFAPVVAGGVVYLGTREFIAETDVLGPGHAVAIRASEILWKTSLPAYANHPAEGGTVRSGALTASLFIVAARSGRMHAFDRTSGEQRWERVGDSAYEAGVVVLGDVAITANLRGDVEGLDVATGSPRWAINLHETSISLQIVAEDGCAVVVLGRAYCFEPTGDIRWEHGGAGWRQPSYATPGRVAERRLFIGSIDGYHALRTP